MRHLGLLIVTALSAASAPVTPSSLDAAPTGRGSCAGTSGAGRAGCGADHRSAPCGGGGRIMRGIVLALSLMGAPAFAQVACGPHAEIVALLVTPAGQQLVALGETASNPPELMELFVNRETGAWTQVFTNPAGFSCAPFFGTRMLLAPPPEPPITPGDMN